MAQPVSLASALVGTTPHLGPDSDTRRTRIKICGCTTAEDVALATRAGADAVGVIFAPSPRRVSFQQAALALAQAPAEVALIGVFVDPSPADLEQAVRAVPRLIPQFSGSEPPELCRHLGRPYLKVIPIAAGDDDPTEALERRLAQYPDALAVFETASRQRGGSGRTFDWTKVRQLSAQRQLVVSGGLNPGNVAECVSQLHPYAVDVRSGVESRGAKDPSKIAEFIGAVRSADAAS